MSLFIYSGLYSGFTIANRGSATEENELYTEVKEPENLDKKEAFKQQSPVYATLEPNETVFNPIYADWYVFSVIPFKSVVFQLEEVKRESKIPRKYCYSMIWLSCGGNGKTLRFP